MFFCTFAFESTSLLVAGFSIKYKILESSNFYLFKVHVTKLLSSLNVSLLLQWKQAEPQMVWLAIAEDAVTLLDLACMQSLARYPYSSVLTFGGCQDDFMLVVTAEEGLGSQKLLFSLSKPKVIHTICCKTIRW